VNHIDASVIRALLRVHGVEFLSASDDQQDSAGWGQIVAFLHGNAGEHQQAEAIDVLRQLRGVESVEVSPASWTILVVRFRTAPDERR
jgi:hypothetical protein